MTDTYRTASRRLRDGVLLGLVAVACGSGVTAVAQTPGTAKAALKGWQLTPANTGLAAVGLRCDDLAVYDGPSKPEAGTEIRERRIEKQLNLSNGDIKIERSCIRPTSIGRGTHVLSTTDACVNNRCPPARGRVEIRDSEIDGSRLAASQIAYSCAFIGVGILERNYIHDTGSGICFYNTGDQLPLLADGNYVHRMRAWGDPTKDGSHNSAATLRDFVTHLHPDRRGIIRNNRFDIDSGNDTGALFMQTSGNIDQIAVEGNLFEGQNYQLQLEARFGNVYGRNMSVVNNRFSGTGYGYCHVETGGLSYKWSVWTDNYINDTAKPDHRGRKLGPGC